MTLSLNHCNISFNTFIYYLIYLFFFVVTNKKSGSDERIRALGEAMAEQDEHYKPSQQNPFTNIGYQKVKLSLFILIVSYTFTIALLLNKFQ